LQLRDHGFDFIELAVWRVLRLLASIADEFALVVRRDFAVAAKRAELGGVSIGGSERSEAWRARGGASSRGPWDHPRLHRQQALALQFLARELAGAADGFRLLSDSLLGGLLVMAAELHLAEDALALHLLLQHFEGLVDIVVTDENLHAASLQSNG